MIRERVRKSGLFCGTGLARSKKICDCFKRKGNKGKVLLEPRMKADDFCEKINADSVSFFFVYKKDFYVLESLILMVGMSVGWICQY